MNYCKVIDSDCLDYNEDISIRIYYSDKDILFFNMCDIIDAIGYKYSLYKYYHYQTNNITIVDSDISNEDVLSQYDILKFFEDYKNKELKQWVVNTIYNYNKTKTPVEEYIKEVSNKKEMLMNITISQLLEEFECALKIAELSNINDKLSFANNFVQKLYNINLRDL